MIMMLEFVYILTMFICVAAFSVHITVRFKDIRATSSLVKQRSTTFFLLTILVFNLCDFLIIYMNKVMDNPDLTWIYVAENVLEVILIFSLICMERNFLNIPVPRAVDVVLSVVCMIIIYLDGILDWSSLTNEKRFFWVMILINAIPIVLLAGFSISFRKEASKRGDFKSINRYMTEFNIFCIFLCAVCTISNADAQTRHQFVIHSDEAYELIWLVFNILVFDFVWRSIDPGRGPEHGIEMDPDLGFRLLQKKYGLSDRERDIARLVFEGKNNKDIASELFLSPNTVKVHVSNLYKKIGAENRVQAVQIIGSIDLFREAEKNQYED